MELSYAEPFRGAGGLLCALRGQLNAGREWREIPHALGAVRRDDEMRLATLACETRQQRANDAFVIRVCEYRDHGALRLGVGGMRHGRAECARDHRLQENAHVVH